MKSNGIHASALRGGAAAALALLAACAARAADVAGSLVTQDGKTFSGVVRWKASAKVYVVSTGKIDLEFPPSQVREMTVPEPPGYAEAVKAVREGRPQQAVPALERIAQDYAMLQWDEPATRALAEACLAGGDVPGALRACDRVIAARPEAAYAGEMAPLYWQALLRSGRASRLEDLLEQAVKTGAPEAAASALVMRGDALSAKGDFRAALKDGYLRVVTLFRAVRAVQPEALFKAAKAFDQMNQPGRAEAMRKQLLAEFGGSDWAAQVKGGK
jgi:tetratricopeptide (TPR) repeat protein